MLPVVPALGSWGWADLWSLLASLAKRVSLRFREKLCLKKWTGKWLRKTAGVDFWPTHARLHTYKDICAHAYRKEKTRLYVWKVLFSFSSRSFVFSFLYLDPFGDFFSFILVWVWEVGCFCFETESHYIAQTDLKLRILLPQSPKWATTTCLSYILN